MKYTDIREIVDDYVTVFPEEADKLRLLQERLTDDKLVDQPFNYRKSFGGHGTAGAIVLSPDLQNVLLIHHRALDKWLQPGGHWDPEEPNPWTAAAREAQEETGIQIARQLHIDPSRPYLPIDIDSHHIPANTKKQEPEHYHHDFRYVFVATTDELKHQDNEVSEAAWVPLRSGDSRLAEVQNSIAKLQRFKLI